MVTNPWPALDHPALVDMLDTLHLWTQVVGKVKLACLPWLNESWHVPLEVTAEGLGTGLVTYRGMAFEMAFDLLEGDLRVASSDGARSRFGLEPGSVASFHASTLEALREIGVDLSIPTMPCEMPGAKPFPDDTTQRVFDLEAARSFWRALIQVQRVFHRFRSRFVGKCSPIHFFWGSFDLAVTRFSGRAAPQVTHGGPNMSLAVARDAYAGEQVSSGFWPGGNGVDQPSFYVEAWPLPKGFADAEVRPSEANFVKAIDEWVLPYAAVRVADDPDAVLLEFLQSAYEAVAVADGWDRARLERPEGPIGRPPAL